MLRMSHYTAIAFGAGLTVLVINIWEQDIPGLIVGAFLSVVFFLATQCFTREGN